MKTSTYLSLVAAALTLGMGATNALAQAGPDQPSASARATEAPQLGGGAIPRYRVTYFYSNTNASFPPRNVSIVSITNQNIATCTVAVDWRVGFGGVPCSTFLALGPGNTADFCTRPIPFNVTACNSTCPGVGLTFTEGSAIVGSTTATGCEKIAVSARTVYTGATSDTSISAITDAKVVRWFSGNIGD